MPAERRREPVLDDKAAAVARRAGRAHRAALRRAAGHRVGARGRRVLHRAGPPDHGAARAGGGAAHRVGRARPEGVLLPREHRRAAARPAVAVVRGDGRRVGHPVVAGADARVPAASSVRGRRRRAAHRQRLRLLPLQPRRDVADDGGRHRRRCGGCPHIGLPHWRDVAHPRVPGGGGGVAGPAAAPTSPTPSCSTACRSCWTRAPGTTPPCRRSSRSPRSARCPSPGSTTRSCAGRASRPRRRSCVGFDSAPILAEKSLWDLAEWTRGHPELADAVRADPAAVWAGGGPEHADEWRARVPRPPRPLRARHLQPRLHAPHRGRRPGPAVRGAAVRARRRERRPRTRASWRRRPGGRS